MKVVVQLHVNDEVVEYRIGCGDGDKSFKWLGMVVTERHATCTPNGAYRKVHSTHGISNRVQQLPSDIWLSDGTHPTPDNIIRDYLTDGDVVYITLSSAVSVSAHSCPNITSWGKTAYYSSDVFANNTESDEINNIPKEIGYDFKANSTFMRNCLISQMFDTSKTMNIIDAIWSSVPVMIPRLTEQLSSDLRRQCYDYSHILSELYHHFANQNQDNSKLLNFTLFSKLIDELEIFYQNDMEAMCKKLFKSITSRSECQVPTLTFGEFLASLVLCAQLRHNDTLDSHNRITNCHDAFAMILKQNVLALSSKLQLPCLIRIEIFKEQNLYKFRKFYDRFMMIFDKYACKNSHELPLTVTDDQMFEILVSSGLMYAADKRIVLRIMKENTRSWEIIGRDKENYESIPEEEFTFAEFFEVILRASVRRRLLNQPIGINRTLASISLLASVSDKAAGHGAHVNQMHHSVDSNKMGSMSMGNTISENKESHLDQMNQHENNSDSTYIDCMLLGLRSVALA